MKPRYEAHSGWLLSICVRIKIGEEVTEGPVVANPPCSRIVLAIRR